MVKTPQKLVQPVTPTPKAEQQVLEKAIPTGGSSAGSGRGDKKPPPRSEVAVEARKKTPEKARVAPKEMPQNKSVAKKLEEKAVTIPVVEEAVDEEEDKKRWLEEQAKHPRRTDGLSEEQRMQRLKGAEAAARRKASEGAEDLRQVRYMGKGEGLGGKATSSTEKSEVRLTQLDRVEQKLDWMVGICLGGDLHGFLLTPSSPIMGLDI